MLAGPLGIPTTPLDVAAFDLATPGRAQLAALPPVFVQPVGFAPGDAGPPAAPPVFGVPLPEPGTWTQMLIGFGAIGGAVRLSRRATSEARPSA